MFGDILNLHTQEPNITPLKTELIKQNESKPCINGKIEKGFSTHEEDQSVIDVHNQKTTGTYSVQLSPA